MKLWGGRFSQQTHRLLEQFNASIHVDKALAGEDITGSLAHVNMLNKIGLLTADELSTIQAGLSALRTEINAGQITFSEQHEDIHMNIEALLTERIGDLAKKIHTARSRNDQVALDIRLYTISKSRAIQALLSQLMQRLIDYGEQHIDTILPGYTHLQRAQPIRLSFYLMAYFQMLRRDYTRFDDLLKRIDQMPLGAGALSGASYSTDRHYLAVQLDFSEPTDNALDTVSDRDFIIEFNSIVAIVMMHLSRWCEEIIIWNSAEFRFITLSDAFTTGSSMMPQKKNPDAAELIRGKTGRVYGNLMNILTVMKALPLAYNKDMQEDKESLFDSAETVQICLAVMIEMLDNITFNAKTMHQAATNGYLNATDLADYLVKKGISFRNSHDIVGRIVRDCVAKSLPLEDLPLAEYKRYCLQIDDDVYKAIALENVIENKRSYGSTARDEVIASIARGRQFIMQYDKQKSKGE